MAKKTTKAIKIPLEKRDFEKEYQDLFEIRGSGIESVDYELNEDSGHIKKFSLLKKTPTPVLTSYTFTTNC